MSMAKWYRAFCHECEVRFVAELVGIALRKAGDALSVCDRTECFVLIALGGSQGSDPREARPSLFFLFHYLSNASNSSFLAWW